MLVVEGGVGFRSPGLMCGGGSTPPCDLSHGVCDVYTTPLPCSCEQTDARENITFPQLLLRAIKTLCPLVEMVVNVMRDQNSIS